MINVVEFKGWLAKCCSDAEEKLKLSKLEIAFVLFQEAQKYLFEVMRKERS